MSKSGAGCTMRNVFDRSLNQIRKLLNDMTTPAPTRTRRCAQSLERDYIQTYRLLSSSEQNPSSLQLNMDRIVTTVRTWFEGRERRWLLVYNNVHSLDDDTDPYFVDL